MPVTLKDISKKRWHETGGIPTDNLIANIEALAEALNALELDASRAGIYLDRFFCPGTVQRAIDAPGTYTLLAGRKHPKLAISHIFMQVGSASDEDSVIKMRLNRTGCEIIQPLKFKKTEGRGKTRVATIINPQRIIGRNESVDIIYEGNQVIVISATFEPVGE